MLFKVALVVAVVLGAILCLNYANHALRMHRLAQGRRKLIYDGKTSEFRRCTCRSLSRPEPSCPLCGPMMRGKAA